MLFRDYTSKICIKKNIFFFKVWFKLFEHKFGLIKIIIFFEKKNDLSEIILGYPKYGHFCSVIVFLWSFLIYFIGAENFIIMDITYQLTDPNLFFMKNWLIIWQQNHLRISHKCNTFYLFMYLYILIYAWLNLVKMLDLGIIFKSSQKRF